MASKFLAFFLTDNGIKTSFFAATVAITSGVLVKYLPNTFLMEDARNVLQLYKNSLPVPVSPTVVQKLEQVKKDMNLHVVSKELTSEKNIAERIAAFTILGFDLYSIGSATYRTGSLIGVPANFAYKSTDDIDKNNIKVGQKSVHWTSPDGLTLASSLVLSDSAQKFALAREISIVSSHQLTMNCFLNGAALFLHYQLTYKLNRKAQLFRRSLNIRLVFYFLIGSFMFTLWLLFTDFMSVRRDALADEQAAAISEEYAQGALEFYSKAVQRNIALRSLLGPDEGPKQFTPFGNIKETFRTKHLPFVTRRDQAALRCEKFKSSKVNSMQDDAKMIVTVKDPKINSKTEPEK